jgi:hypothetical protein
MLVLSTEARPSTILLMLLRWRTRRYLITPLVLSSETAARRGGFVASASLVERQQRGVYTGSRLGLGFAVVEAGGLLLLLLMLFLAQVRRLVRLVLLVLAVGAVVWGLRSHGVVL